jgi:hypothetical protein
MLNLKGVAIWQNIATGRFYVQLPISILNATNNADGQQMVMYYDKPDRIFVREQKEFALKFKYIGEITQDA